MTAKHPEPAILTEELTKSYRGLTAVDGLDLAVPAGEIFGFLGPNGAGKTTTVGMLCTLLRPTRGGARVVGYDVRAEPDRVRREIGVIFQESSLDGELTAEENLWFQARLHGLSRRRGRAAIAAALELVGLAERAGAPVRTYSGGMRRRLELARGLLHQPAVLFLDEPTTGLDPQSRVAIWNHLHDLRRERGTTIFLTTHQLTEAEHCDRIAIIDQGRTVAEGTPAQLRAVAGTDLITIRTGDDAVTVRRLAQRYGVSAWSTPDGVRLRVAGGAEFVPKLCADLALPVYAVTVTPPTLDDVFLHYTGDTMSRAAETRPPAAATTGARGS